VVTRRAGAKRRSRRLDDSFGGGDTHATVQWGSRTFGDWQRYRSTFNEAIGLPAMSEHLPGVTMTVQPAVSFGWSGYRRAVISGQDLEFHTLSFAFPHPRVRR